MKPRVLNDRLPLPGAGLAVKPVAFWVTASMMLCWPRSAMVSAVITSTLAGVCNGVRLSRLPVDVGVFRLKVGDGSLVATADEAAAAAAAGFAPLRGDRFEAAARRSSARRLAGRLRWRTVDDNGIEFATWRRRLLRPDTGRQTQER